VKKLNEVSIDEVFETFVLIKEMNLRTSKVGKKYQQFKFRDEAMELNGFLWDTNDYTITNFVPGTVVHIQAKKELYQGMPQLNQIRLRLPNEDEPSNPTDFEKQPSMNAKQMEEEISKFLFKIEKANWQRITRKLVDTYREQFFEYPAAKTNHHNFTGGLAFHTITMLHLAEKIIEIYPQVNASLLYAGIILHDLGKVIELTGPINTQYTLAGNLLGHIAIMDEEIIKAARDLKIEDTKEEVIVLRHLILSHHGQLEFGSPVVPKILEAEILHQIDNFDAKMMMMLSNLEQIAPGEVTPRVMGLEGRNFYKPNY
jgi:3'-5' exoribonuclease